MSSLYFHKSRRPGDDPVKRARGGLETTCFEIQHGCGYEFLRNVKEFFEIILSLFNQSNASLELRDGDQAEFLSRRNKAIIRPLWITPSLICKILHILLKLVDFELRMGLEFRDTCF